MEINIGNYIKEHLKKILYLGGGGKVEKKRKKKKNKKKKKKKCRKES